MKSKSKLPADLKAIPGKVWARAHYKKSGEDVVVVDDAAWLPTKVFEEGEVPGSAHCFIERTIQVKQYEPLKISVGCSVPCRSEEKEAAIDACITSTKKKFMEAMKQITLELKSMSKK